MSEVRFEIRPLGLWDRPLTEERRSSAQFRATWSDTINLLKSEVEHLGGTLVIVQIDVTEGDIRRDGMLRANAKTNSPKVKISFDSIYGPLTYATDTYVQLWTGAMPGWQANVRAIALGLQALRAVDRYGITKTGEQYRGWTAISDKPADQRDLTVADARLVFADALKGARVAADDIDWATSNGVNLAYRQAAKLHHPDVIGGDGSVFRLITKARAVLLAAAR